MINDAFNRRGPAVRAFVVFAALAASTVASSTSSASTGQGSTKTEISRTPWQVYITAKPHGRLTAGKAVPGNNAAEGWYADAKIPAVDAKADANGSGWKPAPNPDTIQFDGSTNPPQPGSDKPFVNDPNSQTGGPNASRLKAFYCGDAVDYTYFQTIVDVPEGVTPNTFTVDFAGMDDGSQISIQNSKHTTPIVAPGGRVSASSAVKTASLAEYLVTGLNRVVITQMDNCRIGNTLRQAKVTLNGTNVVVTPTDDTDKDGESDEKEISTELPAGPTAVEEDPNGPTTTAPPVDLSGQRPWVVLIPQVIGTGAGRQAFQTLFVGGRGGTPNLDGTVTGGTVTVRTYYSTDQTGAKSVPSQCLSVDSYLLPECDQYNELKKN